MTDASSLPVEPLTLAQYQQLSLRTAPQDVTSEHDIQHALLGLISEVGELADALKKAHAYGKPLDRINLIEEGADILWYLPVLARGLGTSLEEMARRNIAKLQVRYPGRFTAERALNRDLAAERRVLEGGAVGCVPLPVTET